MTTREDSQLVDVVVQIIERRRAQVRINPSRIATEALAKIDPRSRSLVLVRLGCHLQLRQIARAQCRKLFETSGGDDEPLFSGFDNLQWRYPTARSEEDGEPEYVLRDQMTQEDVVYNAARLRNEGNAKLAHADALEAWWETHSSREASA